MRNHLDQSPARKRGLKTGIFITLISIIALFLLTVCQNNTSRTDRSIPKTIQGTDFNSSSNSKSKPLWPTHGWSTDTPENQGMISSSLAEMFEEIYAEEYAIDSVTIVRNGQIVADATIYPFKPNQLHIIHSCTKSIVSTLIGIAIEQGLINGVDTPVTDIFPERIIENLDARKKAMTLEHLLTMTSGFECRDSYLYRWEGLRKLRQQDDWVHYMLNLPMIAQPGEQFEYCNGVSFLLSTIIQETTGSTTLAYAKTHLFNPLGIEKVEWPTNPQGINIGWGELQMFPHDMAKIGYLFLNQGQWEGQQIISADWVERSTRKYKPATLQDGYGYQWWISSEGIYMALGYAGQYIFVDPNHNLVVVFTSHLEEQDFYTPQRLLNGYIIPAVKSETELPPDQTSYQRLLSIINQLADASTE